MVTKVIPHKYDYSKRINKTIPMKTKDVDIRNFLNSIILKEYLNDSDTKIINEFDVCRGNTRIDVAVINGSITGYEIKSDSDTLYRLPNQIELYCKVFDKITIICGKAHTNKILNLVPKWWGVLEVTGDKYGIKKSNIRSAKKNKFIDAYSVSQLLWKNEALELLSLYELSKGLSNKTVNIIWKKIADSISLENIQDFVREKLKKRPNWRAGKPQIRYAGLSRSVPRSLDFQRKNLDSLLSQISHDLRR